MLTNDEEQQLMKWILSCHKKGLPTSDENMKWSVKKVEKVTTASSVISEIT